MADESTALRPDLEYPRIRSVEAIPLPEGSQEGICLRDPRQFAENVLVLPPAVFYLVTLFDGSHSLRDIQELFLRQYQSLIPIAKIQEIVLKLDRELFLESQTFEEHCRQALSRFRSSPVREAAHAGTAYAGESDELQRNLNGLLDTIQNRAPDDALPAEKPLQLLIAPHIDLHRGGTCFAFAYRELLRRSPADLYIVLGTAHHGERSVVTLTRKSYSTPLGPIETDRDFVDELSSKTPFDCFEEEILHRDEHSIEFQIVWLRHILGDAWRGKAVPILCGSFHPHILKGTSPREDRNVAAFLDALRVMMDRYPGKAAVIAGVDMSHVGRRFGHSEGISARELARVAQDDAEVLQAMRGGDAESFYRAVEKKKDRNNICGLSPIYMSLELLRPQRGYLLHYDRAIEEDTQSVVTYASMAFLRE